MPEREVEKGRMELAGVDIRRIGLRDRMVLGLALGSAVSTYRHSSEENEPEDWISRAALDVCVALDVLDNARTQLSDLATRGGSAESVVHSMLALSGIGVAALGRAIRDVDCKSAEELDEQALEAAISESFEKGGEANVILTPRGRDMIELLELLALPLRIEAANELHKWLAKTDPETRVSIAGHLREAMAEALRPIKFDLEDAAMSDSKGDLKEFLKNYPGANPAGLAAGLLEISDSARQEALLAWGAFEESDRAGPEELA